MNCWIKNACSCFFAFAIIFSLQDDYEDIFRRFAMLDEYGQKNVESVLRNEFIRCHEQGTLNSGKGVSISVRVRTVEDPVNEDLPN